MKIIPKTKKDFAWVNFTPKEIKEYTQKVIGAIAHDAEAIKRIPKGKRNFENTVFAVNEIGESNLEDSPVSFLAYVSTDEKTRKSSREFQEAVSKKSIDLSFDRRLYEAFKEFDKSKEKLSNAEVRLYEDIKKGFEDQGFHLAPKEQKELKAIKKRLTTLGIKFSKNIDSYHDQILCSREELRGLPENYISNLKIDKKTKKRIVTLAYPELGPFMKFAESDKKRKQLADKSAQRGGKENLAILKEILSLRNKMAKLLGYENFVAFSAKDLIAKNPENIREFLVGTIEKLRPRVDKEIKNLERFISKKYPGKKLQYFNIAYFSTKMKEAEFSYDQKEVKEYFEIENVLEKMKRIFGNLFGVSFRKNTNLPLWHKDAEMFDVIEKDKVIGHFGLDLYPRKDKYSHMGCSPLVPGKLASFRNKNEYLAPVSIIVGNFPVSSKDNPSLLSVGEVETIFHEFGHTMHGVLTRAGISSQSGTNVLHDFVEMPSQLFENWTRDKANLRFISEHWKTGKKMNERLIEKVIRSSEFMKAHQHYYTFVISLQDFEMHSDKWNMEPLKLSKDFNNRYATVASSPKSLFPASWGHMVGYEAKYYSYMWALVYSYDVFSRFKKEGIMNKKVGMELRRKILEKGDSEDPLKLMEDFLGRKPNNKAFLEALK